MSAKLITIRDPYSGKMIRELPFASREEAQLSLQRAEHAFDRWKRSSAWEKSEALLHVARDLESSKSDFAKLICQEAGKPIQLAQSEVDRAINVIKWAAVEAQRFSGELLRLDVTRSGRQGFGIHTHFPRGVILGITPFNFPLNLVMHKVAPAVAAGCSILIKPSPSTPLTTLKLSALFEKVCPGVVQCILADDALTEELTRSTKISMVSFTGSARVGKLIQKQSYDKPVVLELGGNAWAIVMGDVPSSAFPAVAKKIALGAYGYAGQSCISVQNVAVASSIWPEFEKELRAATEITPFGNPSEADVLSGPVINDVAATRIRNELKKLEASPVEFVTSSKNYGSIVPGSACLIAPTLILAQDLITQTSPPVRSFQQEEIFAPVMLAGKFDSLDDLIGLINSSPYGLQTGVFTQNLAAIERLYRDLQVGGLVVNDAPTTRYDHQPYGGVKESGQGREGVRYAMEEMSYSKFLALSGQLPAS